MDPQLIINTEERNKYINAKNMNENTGLYGTYEVKPTVIDANGREIKCQCGSQFSNESSIIFQGSGILYTRMGPIETNYYNICVRQINVLWNSQKKLRRRIYSCT